tara:strand:+ start:2684 stop:4045 length:1362 start_codon:yes stop_codon:yes gene_type:complete
MIKLQSQDGFFIRPDTKETLPSIKAVITSRGVLARNYYKAQQQVCWSSDGKFPSSVATEPQAARCLDCPQSIKRGGFSGAPCKFFKVVTLAILDNNIICSLRLSGQSLFSKKVNQYSLRSYEEHLAEHKEEVAHVLTEIYFEETNGYNNIYFKPVRPLAEEELAKVERLIKAASPSTNPFEQDTEELFMANQTHIIKNVEARYPRLDNPYRFDNTAGKNGKSVPCDALEDGAKYELDFLMTQTQAKELYSIMQEVYTNAVKRDKSWPDTLEMPFKKQEDGTFLGKAVLKAAYNGAPTVPPAQFDAQNERLGADFLLTTGSTVNAALEMIPYKMASTGVSLRLRGVQVIQYLPYKPASPFDAEDGGFTADTAKSLFATSDEPDEVPVAKKAVVTKQMLTDLEADLEADPFADSPAPKKAAAKEPVKRAKKAVDTAPAEDAEVAAIIDIWGSEED